MRCLIKEGEPAILIENGPAWLAAFIADRGNATKRYRYRALEIKATLRRETGDKCIYCESKLGHNTPGDVEHKVPTDANDALHFSWNNLTLACTECNRRKLDYFSEETPFLDPYVDDVETFLVHHGPVVFWQAGNTRAEVSVKTLELNTAARMQLIARKIEKIEEVTTILERHNTTPDVMLKAVLRRQLFSMS